MTAGLEAVAAYWRSPLGRRIALVLGVVLSALSFLFLPAFVYAYRQTLITEHARASNNVNELLEASLRSAMLRRDIPALQQIIADLSHQPGISAVHILAPSGEIRFATDTSLIGQHLALPLLSGQAPGTESVWSLVPGAAGEDVVRTINPVRNDVPCQTCHGSVAKTPVNGLLVVDYKAGGIVGNAIKGTVLLAASGAAVLLAALIAIGWALSRDVLQPIQSLDKATRRLTDGDLDVRLDLPGATELASLAARFNMMAERTSGVLTRLRSNEDFLQQLIDAVPDGIRVIGPDYRILKVNSAYCRQLGTTAEKSIGQFCHASSHKTDEPCSPTLLACPLAELSSNGKTAMKCRHCHIRDDGSEVFVEVSAAAVPLAVGDSQALTIVESIRDLSDQAELSHQQRLSELGQLATGVAHEIHNPLSSIQLALRALSEDLKGAQHGGRGEDYVAITLREIDRCLEVTSRLLRVSEPPTADKTLVEVRHLLSDVAALLGFQALAAGVVIEQFVTGNPRVFVNDSDIAAVILNLAQNAIHAMPAGGILRLKARPDADSVIISCEDSGIGIAGEDIQKIFWPFWSKRADGSPGSGLGLSICKAAAQRMGGTLTVRSTLGKGSEFTLTLPNQDRNYSPS